MGDFYGTGIKIWTGFRPVGITEKKIGSIMRPVFSCLHGKKYINFKNIVVSALKSWAAKSCIK